MPEPVDNTIKTAFGITDLQSSKTPYEDLSWLEKANYGFSENMYNQPLVTGTAPGGGTLGAISKIYGHTKDAINYLDENPIGGVSSESAFNAQNNRINAIAEQTGTATSHGSVGVGGGMYMENPGTFEDGAEVKKTEVQDYFTAYLKSPLFKRRAIDLHGEDNWESVRDAKLKRLENTEVDFSGEEEWLEIYNEENPTLGAIMHASRRIPEIQSRYKRPNYKGRGNENPIIKVNPGQAITMREDLNLSYNPFNSIVANEYSHALGATSGSLDPFPYPMTEEEIKLSEQRKPNAPYDSHDSNSWEMKSDIDTTRYELWKAGLYNFEEDFMFDESHMDYIKNNPSKFIKDTNLFDQYDDDQIIKMMNTFTSNDVNDASNVMKAEDGGPAEIDWDKLYEGIYRREHRGYWNKEGYNPYIRTKGTKGQRKGTQKGSTAYGPIQITGDRLQDLVRPGRRRFYWDDPTADFPSEGGVSWDPEYVDKLIEQSRLFMKYGGVDMPAGGIDPKTKKDVSRYGYGQTGDLSGEEYHQKYKDLGIVMLKGTYNMLKDDLGREPTMEELVKHWRGGSADEEPEYVTDVVNYYNSKPKVDFTKVMGSTTYKPEIPFWQKPYNFPKASENKKDGGKVYTYARGGEVSSRYMKAYQKFNDGGPVGNSHTEKFTGWVKDRKVYTPEGTHPNTDREMLFKNKYNTELSDEEMKDFLLWATNWKDPNTGRGINMMDEGAYDVRGYWKSGDWKNTDSRGHGSDTWKKPNHPTFSEESIYSKQKGGSEFDGGVWMDNGAFIPGYHNMYDNDRLLWEFSRDEGIEHLIGSYVLPEVTVTP